MTMDKIFYEKIMNDTVVGGFKEQTVYESLTPKVLKKILRDYLRLLNKYDIYQKGVINDFLYDLTNAMENADLTPIQKTRLDLWLYGYTEQEIATKDNVVRQVVGKSMNGICNKILKEMRGD